MTTQDMPDTDPIALPPDQRLAIRDYVEERTDRTFRRIAWLAGGFVTLLGIANISTCHDMTRVDDMTLQLKKDVEEASAMVREIRAERERLLNEHAAIAQALAANPQFIDKVTLLLLPVGSIVAWFRDDAPPSNWAICNGSSGTPDLTGRFILGSSTNEPSPLLPSPARRGATGPAHWIDAAEQSGVTRAQVTILDAAKTSRRPADLNNATHDHPVPYYALRFIMRLK